MTHINGVSNSILETIGNTPVVRLNSVSKGLPANIYVKCEFMNPGGSIKDRIALHMVNEAEKRGDLRPGATIIEATSGNTGLGLALVAANRGYKCIFVMADKQSEEKRTLLRSAGARVIVCPTDVAPEDPRSYYQVAEKLAADIPNSFYNRQYTNLDNPAAHYHSTGPEIWKTFGASLDYFICSIGTGGTVSGISRYLKEQNDRIKIIGVDPIGSLFHEIFYTGKFTSIHSYYVEGIGEDFMPATMNLKSMDDIVQVNDKESFSMARRLIKEEGLLCGGSSGTAVAGAIKYLSGKSFDSKPNVLIVLPDASSRYLSKFMTDSWLKDIDLLEENTI